MRTIQVNYDLRKPGRNYEPVYDYLKSFSAYSHPLESLWLVRTWKSASPVRDELKQHVDRNDQVLVFDVTGDSWASNFDTPAIQWLHGHMSAAA
jgi:hypothetical protein